jgi:hypothetical protein
MLTTSMYYTLCADSVTVIESPTGDCEPLHRAIVKADIAAAATASTATVSSTAAAAMDEIEEQRPPATLPTIGILINKEEALPPLTVLTRENDMSLSDSPATGTYLHNAALYTYSLVIDRMIPLSRMSAVIHTTTEPHLYRAVVSLMYSVHSCSLSLSVLVLACATATTFALV